MKRSTPAARVREAVGKRGIVVAAEDSGAVGVVHQDDTYVTIYAVDLDDDRAVVTLNREQAAALAAALVKS